MRELSPELALVDADLARDARAALPEARDVLTDIARHWESEPIRHLRAVLTAETAPERRRSRRPALYLVAGGLAGLTAVAGAAAALRPPTSDEAARLPAVKLRPAALPAKHAAPARSAPAKKAPAAPTPQHVEPARPPAAVVRHVPVVRRPAPHKLSVTPRHAVPTKPLLHTVGQAVSKPASTKAVPIHLPVLRWAADEKATHYRVGLFRDGDPPTLVCEVWTDDARLALASVSTPASRPLSPGQYRWVVYPVFGGNGSPGSGDTADTQLAQGTFTL
jgi:hypothetical protein